MKPARKQKKKYKVKNSKHVHYNNEIIGVLIFAFGVLTLLSFYFKNSIGLFGAFIRDSFTGLLGLPAFIIPPLIIIGSVFIIFKKNEGVLKQRIIYTAVLIILISALIQTGAYEADDYSGLSLVKCITGFYWDGVGLNGGGILGGLVSLPFLLLFKTLGTIIILTTLALIDIILLTNISIANFIMNIKSLCVRKLNRSEPEKKPADRKAEDYDSIPFEPDIAGKGGRLGLELKQRPRVIDFRIEKTSRDLKGKSDGYQDKGMDIRSGSRLDGRQDGLAEHMEEEPVQLIMKDIKSARKKSPDAGGAGGSGCDAGFENPAGHGKLHQNYRYPPLTLLNEGVAEDGNLKNYKVKAIEAAKKLEGTLESFGVEAKVINISRGPTVTRFELQPSAGVKVSRIVNLADDISLNLASSGVRIEAPIPGKAAIGIEVPNKEVSTVLLRDVLESAQFINHSSRLAFSLGQDISGECVVADIAKMPHLLIAGATGAGKSVCINCVIVSLLYKSSPDEVKLLMIDPKVVELSIYNGIPHLLIPVVTDPRKAAGALNWAVQEMVNRYKLFADKGVRDLKGYNEMVKKEGVEEALPQVVIIIDELADLMMVAPNDVEDAICRLAQMARAAGMHLVIATQRPSVDVITGVIKANIPSRISFAVSSQVDSRTILDMAGAEKLLGKGDMLFHPVGQAKPTRIQGAFISDSEVEKVVEFLKAQGDAEYNNDIIEEINSEEEPVEEQPGDNDELLPRVIEMVVEAGQASVSLVQRRFKVGYARAARIIDQMEARGIIGGYEGSKPRQILISRQQWQEMQMSGKEE